MNQPAGGHSKLKERISKEVLLIVLTDQIENNEDTKLNPKL